MCLFCVYRILMIGWFYVFSGAFIAHLLTALVSKSTFDEKMRSETLQRRTLRIDSFLAGVLEDIPCQREWFSG